jgi:hypothetical protein
MTPSMKILLLATALLEAGAGVALLLVPSVAVQLLLGSPLEAPAAVTLGRVAGTALLALGVACWGAGGDTKNRAARGLVMAMLLYNLGVTLILAVAGSQSPKVGVLLWPAVILHAALVVGCGACLRRSPAQRENRN